jgi:hypothetical protein
MTVTRLYVEKVRVHIQHSAQKYAEQFYDQWQSARKSQKKPH